MSRHPTIRSLALAFVGASDLTKLRAMVEDWSLSQIRRELGWAEQFGAPCQRSGDAHNLVFGPNVSFVGIHFETTQKKRS